MDLVLEKQVKAYTFAYLWVAAADGEISRTETRKFLNALTETKAMDLDHTHEINDIFLDTRDFFVGHYTGAAKEAAERISAFNGNKDISAKILDVARRGVIANDKIKVQEEVVLHQIAESLGLENP